MRDYKHKMRDLRFRKLVILSLVICFLGSGISLAREQKVSMEFKNTDIKNVLRILAKQAGLNIIIEDEIKGEVTVSFVEVTLEEALKEILASKGYVYIKTDHIIRVTTPKKLKIETKTFPLKYANGEEIKNSLGSMLSERGSIAVDERTNTLIITDIHQNLIRLEKMIKKLDIEISEEVQIKAEKVKIPTITRMVNLKYAKAEEIKKTLDELKSEKGKIIINEKANAVIVTDTPVNVEKVMEYLMKLDVKPRQVMINAKIVEVTLKKDDALGIDWQKFSFQAWKEGSPAEAYTGNIKTDFSLETAGLTLNIFNQDTDVILNALAKRTKINLLSDPKIVTLNNVEAYIKVGQEIPIPTIETTALGTRTTYTFKDAVIKLTVTPQISEDNYIRIKVRPEIKSVSGYTKAEEAKDQQPIFSTREAETEVLVKDGQTIIIGGLIKELETKEVSRVPFLGKIPILGLLFRGVKSPEAGNEKIELLVFITPHILKEREIKEEVKSGDVEELVREIKEGEIKEEKSRRRKRWERRKQAN